VLWPKVTKLEENRDVGRALEPEEEKAVLDAAVKNRSPLIFPFLQTLVWTGVRSDEARLLQWCQIDFEAGHIVFGKSKQRQVRVIPISGVLRSVLDQHAAWYVRKLGLLEPDWYVFLPRIGFVRPIPTRQVTSLKRAWQGVRSKSQVVCRLHDLRHSFCTKLAEAGVPEPTMLDIMGHVSAAMLRRYSYIRAKARRDAIAAIETRVSSGRVPKESPKMTRSEVAKAAVTH